MSSSWQQVTIKDIAVVDWGNTNLTKKAFVSDGPYLGVSAAGCDGRMQHAEHKKNTPVLSAIGAQCGRMFLPQEDFTAIKNTITLTPLEGVTDPVFLYYLLTFVELPQRGAGQPFISKGDIQKFPVLLPPLEEQQRIVAVLDEAFEGLARARAHAEANLKNAQELFENFLGAIFARNDTDWISASLHELVENDCTLSYGIVQPGEDVSGGLPIVRPTDLGQRIITLDGLKRIDAAKADGYARTTLKGTEILLCVRGSTGVVAMASEELAGANVTRGIVPIRFDSEKMDQRLGYYQFLSRPVQDQITARTYGAALMQINIRDLRKLTFYVPPIAQQEALLERLDSVASDFDTLIEDYTRKVSDADDLRQSLLQQAFAGELTRAKAA